MNILPPATWDRPTCTTQLQPATSSAVDAPKERGMKLATIRIDGTTAAARIDGEAATVLPEPDLDAVLRRAGWHEYVASATGRQVPIDLLDYAPLIRRPDKIICVGLNY